MVFYKYINIIRMPRIGVLYARRVVGTTRVVGRPPKMIAQLYALFINNICGTNK